MLYKDIFIKFNLYRKSSVCPFLLKFEARMRMSNFSTSVSALDIDFGWRPHVTKVRIMVFMTHILDNPKKNL